MDVIRCVLLYVVRFSCGVCMRSACGVLLAIVGGSGDRVSGGAVWGSWWAVLLVLLVFSVGGFRCLFSVSVGGVLVPLWIIEKALANVNR